MTRPCDLDLLVFLHRHPRAVLTSERLALYIGYGLGEVAQSLERLIDAGLLVRVQRPTGSSRMYVLASGGDLGGWLDALVRLALTRNGRLQVLAALATRQASTEPLSNEPPRPDGPELRAARRVRVRPRSRREKEVHCA